MINLPTPINPTTCQQDKNNLGIDEEKKPEDLKAYSSAISSIIGPVLIKFAGNHTKILEIRSSEDSILAYHVPFSQKQKDQIQISSINNKAILNFLTNYPKNPTELIDFGHIKAKLNSYQSILMMDVFNAFTKMQIGKAASELSSILENGGYLIHFSLSQSAFYSNFNEFKGFEIVVSEIQEGAPVGKQDTNIHSNPNVNHDLKNKQISIHNWSDIIPSDIVKESIKIHVLVCKKIGPEQKLPSSATSKIYQPIPKMALLGSSRPDSLACKRPSAAFRSSAIAGANASSRTTVSDHFRLSESVREDPSKAPKIEQKTESIFSSISRKSLDFMDWKVNPIHSHSLDSLLQLSREISQDLDVDDVQKFNKIKQRRIECELLAGRDIWNLGTENFKIRQCAYQRALGNIVTPIIQKYADLDSTLEISCGNFPIREVLTGISENAKDKIWLSEINKSKVEHLSKIYPNAVSKVLDIENITLAKSCLQTIIMKDVLNIFHADSIKKAVQEIKKTLTAGGTVVHFSLEPFINNHLMLDLMKHDTVIFPHVNKYGIWEGAYIVDKKECKKRLKDIQLKLPKTHASLSQYISIAPWERNKFCLIGHDEYKPKNLEQDFAKLNCPILQSINFEKYITETLEKTFREQGFEILLSEEQEGRFIGMRDDRVHPKDKNIFEYYSSTGNDLEDFRDLLPPNLVCEKTKVKVLVCKKL